MLPLTCLALHFKSTLSSLVVPPTTPTAIIGLNPSGFLLPCQQLEVGTLIQKVQCIAAIRAICSGLVL